MSITVTAVKARQNLGELLNLVSIKHEEVIIERAGKKIARLTAIEESAVNEPVAEIYRVQKKKPRNEPLDYNPDVVDPEFEKPGITLAEKIRKERDEWVKADPDIVREEIERFRSIRGVGKEMWEATGLTPDEYVRREREEWDESERRRVPMASSNEDGSN
jgi:antitoxin (DNA-binding transcriptional repressor) of toxin-antitoxin stability system